MAGAGPTGDGGSEDLAGMLPHIDGARQPAGGAQPGGKRGLVQAVARGDQQAELIAADGVGPGDVADSGVR